MRTWIVPGIAAAACLLAAGPVQAETLLHLAETATVMVAPDELAATLSAEAAGPSAAEAQAKVNAVMHDALDRAHKVDGLTVSTGGYGVWQTNAQGHPTTWQVDQALNLTGHDGAALLALVGTLQQRGLVVRNLGWQLSPAAERQARQAATKQALAALRGRVDEAAGLLDLKFEQFKQVRLDGGMHPQPMFRAMAAPMAMTASAAPPPSAAPQDVPVNATAEADAVLVPK